MTKSLETRIPRELSLIEIQLLSNIGKIKSNTEQAGVKTVVDVIKLYDPVAF